MLCAYRNRKMSSQTMAALGWLLLVLGDIRLPTRAQEAQFIAVERFSQGWRTNVPAGDTIWTSEWIQTRQPWKELVTSWNAVCPPGVLLTIQARAASTGTEVTPFYIMGRWSTDPTERPRTSVRNQKDIVAEVQTDTLICRKPMDRVQVRAVFQGQDPSAHLKFIGLCLYGEAGSSPKALVAPRHEVWGRVIDVPQRSQLGYQGASGWCSPTCVSMILSHWAKTLGRPELVLSVPDVARAVHDPGWEGTGNWSFNMAFAGQFEGMRAYVTRLTTIDEIEILVAAGIPVGASVSFDFLNGKAADEGNGHLIVVVGFTKTGDVVANDPWPNPKKENSVRRTFSRESFAKAWERSRRTVYIIHPLAVPLPPCPMEHWK